MKKQLCTLCLALLLLIPGAGTFCSAAEAERTYTCSDWAETDVFSALYYGLARHPTAGITASPFSGRPLGRTPPPWWPGHTVRTWTSTSM